MLAFEQTKQRVATRRKSRTRADRGIGNRTGRNRVRKFNANFIVNGHEFMYNKSKLQASVKAKVIYESDTEDIINQYIVFCKVFNEQIKQHGMTREAVTETIRICKDRNVLSEYLAIREKEGARCPVDVCSARTGVERRT